MRELQTYYEAKQHKKRGVRIRLHANAILDTGMRPNASTLSSPAASEYEGRISKLREEKQRLYETVVLGVISRDEYMAKKDSIDALLDKMLQVYEAILEENKKTAPMRLRSKQ